MCACERERERAHDQDGETEAVVVRYLPVEIFMKSI